MSNIAINSSANEFSERSVLPRINPDDGFKGKLAAVQFFLGIYGHYFTLGLAVLFYIPNRLITVPFRGIVLGGCLLLVFLSISRFKSFYRGWVWWPLLIFWFLFGIRSVVDGFVSPKPMPMPPNDQLLFAFGVCFFPMLGFMRTITVHESRKALLGLIGGVLITVIMISFIYQGGIGTVGRARAGEFLGDFVAFNPLNMSYMGSGAIVLGFYCLADRFFFRSGWIRALIGVLLMIGGLVPFLLGASRGALIAAGFCFLIYIVAKTRRNYFGMVLLYFFLAVLVMGGAYLASEASGSLLFDRLFELPQDLAEGSTSVTRLYLYEVAVKAFLAAPLTGSGLYLPDGTYPHNFIIESFLATGIIGGLSFSIVFFYSCIVAFKLIRDAPGYRWLGLMFFHYAVYVNFSTSIILNPQFWFFTAAVIGVSGHALRRKVHSDGARPGWQPRPDLTMRRINPRPLSDGVL